MNIGVIGVGHIGGTLAEKFVKAGHQSAWPIREGRKPSGRLQRRSAQRLRIFLKSSKERMSSFWRFLFLH